MAYATIGRARVPMMTAQKLLLGSDIAMALWLSFLSLETGGIDSPYQSTLMFVPLSFAVVGPAASAFGVDATLVVAGIAGAVITIAFLFLPGARDPERDGSLMSLDAELDAQPAAR